MKKWPLLISALIFCLGTTRVCFSAELSNWPNSIEQIDKNPLSYQLIKSAFFDLDKFLVESIKVKTKSCQYKSLRKKQTFNYSDTGACVYRLLLDSLFSQTPQSSVFIWGQTDDDQLIQLKLDWRPQLNNFLEVYNQIFEMAFEKQIHTLNKYYKKPFKIDFEKRGFGSETSLLGQISIQTKSSPETISNLLNLISEHPPENIQITGVSIEFSPNGRRNGYMNQNIKVQVWETENSELTHLNLTTNLNLLDPSRKFVIQSVEKKDLK